MRCPLRMTRIWSRSKKWTRRRGDRRGEKSKWFLLGFIRVIMLSKSGKLVELATCWKWCIECKSEVDVSSKKSERGTRYGTQNTDFRQKPPFHCVPFTQQGFVVGKNYVKKKKAKECSSKLFLNYHLEIWKEDKLVVSFTQESDTWLGVEIRCIINAIWCCEVSKQIWRKETTSDSTKGEEPTKMTEAFLS